MKLLSLSCNHCGAPLEVPPKTRFVTCGFCEARLQVVHTGSSYYTEVHEAVAEIREDVKALKRDAVIDRLDRDWERRSIELSHRDKHGRISRPSVAGSAIGAAALGIMAVFLLASGVFAELVLVPVVLILVAIVFGIAGIGKAQKYEREYQSYRQQRRRLMRGEAA